MEFSDVGPLQVLVVGFEAGTRFDGLVLEELERLVSRGTIRVVDLRFVTCVDDGTVAEIELDGLSESERAGFGQVIDSLRQLAGQPEGGVDASAAGLGPTEIEALIADLQPGQSIGILLFEHTWATQLKAVLRGVGGQMLAQGMLTPEAAVMVGAEVAAIADAEATIELAAAVSGAAMLDAAAVVAAAEDVKAAAAVDAIRALIAAEIVADTAATYALESLVEAELISEAAYAAAAAEVQATAEVTDRALAARGAGQAQDESEG